MLLVALKPIPGTIQIEPGQSFYELDSDRQAEWLRGGFARPAEMTVAAVEPPRVDRKGLPDWTAATVVIMASGPSMSAEQADLVADWRLHDITHRQVITINDTYRLAPWADLVYACDGTWWRARRAENGPTNFEAALAAGVSHTRLWTQDVKAAEEFKLNLIRSTAGSGLSKKQGLIHQGMNSGYQCLNIAYLTGARRVILLGYDCHGKHWHPDHPAPLSNRLPHAQWITKFGPLARDLAAEGVTVTNCSPGTALRMFQVGDLRELLT